MPPPVPSRQNVVAIVSLVLAILSLACLIGSLAIMLPPLQEALGDTPTPEHVEAYQRQLQQEIQSGSPPPWAIPAGFLMLFGGAFWLSAGVCAIIGAIRPFGRGWAFGAMAAMLIGPLLVCFGGVVGS